MTGTLTLTVRVGGEEYTVDVDVTETPKWAIEEIRDEDGCDVTSSLPPATYDAIALTLGEDVASELTSRAEDAADLAADQ